MTADRWCVWGGGGGSSDPCRTDRHLLSPHFGIGDDRGTVVVGGGGMEGRGVVGGGGDNGRCCGVVREKPEFSRSEVSWSEAECGYLYTDRQMQNWCQ